MCIYIYIYVYAGDRAVFRLQRAVGREGLL